MAKINFSTFYDDNGETAGFAIRVNGREGYGVFYPVLLNSGKEGVSGNFFGMSMIADDMDQIMINISNHPLVKAGGFEVDYF